MSHTNSTTHYSLSQFISSDTPAWLVDVNGDNQKIDAAIYNNAQAAANNATDISMINTTLSNFLPVGGSTGDVLKRTNTGANWDTLAAADVSYDNTGSGLTAATTQDAIDELASALIVYRDYQTPDTSFAGGAVGSRAGACEVAIDDLTGYVPIAATITNVKSSVNGNIGAPIMDVVNHSVKSVITRITTNAFSEWVSYRITYLKV